MARHDAPQPEGSVVNIPIPDNKAEHTVAMRQLLPKIEQCLRDRKYGMANALLADLGVHSVALKQWVMNKIVDER